MPPWKLLTTDYTDKHGFDPAFIRVRPCNPWSTGSTVGPDLRAGRTRIAHLASGFVWSPRNEDELARNHPPLAPTAGLRASRRALVPRAAAGRAFDGVRAGAGGSRLAGATARHASHIPPTQHPPATGSSNPSLSAHLDKLSRFGSLCAIISPVVSTPGAGPSQGGPCLFLPP